MDQPLKSEIPNSTYKDTLMQVLNDNEEGLPDVEKIQDTDLLKRKKLYSKFKEED